MPRRRIYRRRFFAAAVVAVVGVSNVFVPLRAGAAAGEIHGYAGKTIGIAFGDWIIHPIGGYSGDGEPANDAMLDGPRDVAFDAGGAGFIADTRNNAVRRVDVAGTISTLVAVGVPVAVVVGPDDLVYVATGRTATAGSNQVLRVRGGGLELVAGNGTSKASGDGGPATAAGLDPRAIAFDAAGNLTIADGANHRIRRVDAAGVITTIAGVGGDADGSCSNFGDGGPAREAGICSPSDLAFDASGRLLVATGGPVGLVRRIDGSGSIRTIAGSGSCADGWSFGGRATATPLCGVAGMALDERDNVFVTVTRGRAASYVARVDAVDGRLTRAVGLGCELPDGSAGCFVGNDGPALEAGLNGATGLAFDRGRLLVADTGNNAVRAVEPGGHLAITPGALAFGAQELGVATAARAATFTSSGTIPVSVRGLRLEGSNAADFIMTGEDCSGRMLAPGASCRVFVSFRPSLTGARTAAVHIDSDAVEPPETPNAIALSGIGIAVPRLRVSPNPVDFGTHPIGSITAKTVTVTSAGSTIVTIGGLSIAGGAADDYRITGDACSNVSLVVGASCRVDVAFVPTAHGFRNSALRIPSSASPSPLDVGLLGASGALIQVTPLSIDFGGIPVGLSSTGRDVTIRNIGSDALVVTAASPAGTQARDFVRLADGCTGIPLEPGRECTVTLAFAPTAFGLRHARLEVRSNAAEPLVGVDLTGTGLDAGPPVTSFETVDGSLVLGPTDSIRGTTIDAVSGVAGVRVALTPLIGNRVEMSGSLECNEDRTACTWHVRLPLTLIGPVTVRAWARDSAGNVESPGPTIGTLII